MLVVLTDFGGWQWLLPVCVLCARWRRVCHLHGDGVDRLRKAEAAVTPWLHGFPQNVFFFSWICTYFFMPLFISEMDKYRANRQPSPQDEACWLLHKQNQQVRVFTFLTSTWQIGKKFGADAHLPLIRAEQLINIAKGVKASYGRSTEVSQRCHGLQMIFSWHILKGTCLQALTNINSSVMHCFQVKRKLWWNTIMICDKIIPILYGFLFSLTVVII